MNRLRDERLKQKISQFKLSLKSDVWPSKISWIENGHWNPSEKEKEKLAKALGIKKGWLFSENERT